MSRLRKPDSRKFNPKRTVLSTDKYTELKETLKRKSQKLKYEGKAEHKRNPGDFNLTPPACGRSDKSLCDWSRIFSYKDALRLLREGYTKGLVDIRENNGWPRHIWAVADDEIVLEGKPSVSGEATYHGYPLPPSDPICQEILEKWKVR